MSDASDEEESEELEGAVDEEPKPGPSKPVIRIHPPTPPRTPRARTPYAMDAYNIMRKWNLNFSGARDGEAEAFLIRIKQGRQLILLEDEEIFKCLPFFLSGTAAHWFRLNKHLWRTWGQFEAAWRSRFGFPNFQFTLRDKIMRRRQGEEEPVVDYITCMQALLERLDPPWQLSEQLNYAHRNMLPRLRIAVRRKEVYDFRSLETLASQVEECYEPDRQPNQTRSIFPELAYRATPRQPKHSKPMAAAGISATKPKGKRNATTESKKASVNAIDKANSDPKPSTSAANNTRMAEMRCWNCDGKGHRSRDCTQARILHCYRCVSPKIQKAMREEIDKMLKGGIIEPSFSEWSNPVVMVKKPNGKYRFCLDFRKVNEVSKKDAYPLPNMSAILDKLRAAQYISTLDLSQAYFQIPLAKDSREITAFSVPDKGLYHFTRMPYGLTGAPATFQRLLDKLIGPEMEPFAFAYLDDIIIATPTFEEHIVWLKKVLAKISSADLTINPEKCEFCKSYVKYLGFIVQKEGLTVDPDKTLPIMEFPIPKNIKQLRRFLGIASWYRRFIPHLTTITEPLTRLLKKNKRWEWGEEQSSAVQTIKEHLTTAPVLACPDFERPFVLQTDASSVGVGAVLTQNFEEGERVIAFASRALADPERKYSVTEQECLAVVWAIKKFRPYLEGYKFTVITDHSSLRWLHNLRNPTGRLARWALELLEYDYEIIHRKGALHHVPDALSRSYEGEVEINATVSVAAEVLDIPDTESTDEWYKRRFEQVASEPDRYNQWRVMDERLYFLRPKPVISDIVEDLDRWKLVLPSELRKEALREAHDVPQSGHLGIEKTYQRLAVSYYWPRMFRDVVSHVKKCGTCQLTKVEQANPAGLMGRRIAEAPWTIVAADIMGPLPRSKSGFQYLLVIQDLFTKWIECKTLRSATGPKIRQALEDLIISRWGTPKFLLTDNGTEFV
ncbi:reverse ribonuclease integrase, partial [Lasius niger]